MSLQFVPVLNQGGHWLMLLAVMTLFVDPIIMHSNSL